MADESCQVVIVFNGEIYNHPALRSELADRGHHFRGHSDTEVFLHAYLEWGVQCLERLNGMWAAAIYDARTKQILLSRDRIGVKPLYYHIDESRGLAFASEVKALLELGIPRTVDRDAVDLLLSTQFIPSPFCIFKSIRKLEPRQYLLWDLPSRTATLRHYYTLPSYKPVSDRQQLLREGRALLEDAVRIRLEADVPVGAFLSGGVDSSTVVAEMRRFVLPDRLHTVSMGFDIPALDESEYIHLVQQRFNTNHHHVVFRTGDTESTADEIARVYDEPVADFSSFPTYRLCQETRKWMVVALSGDGGDEIFGGYAGRQTVAQFVAICRMPRPLRRALHTALARVKGYDLTRLGRLAEALRVSLLDPVEYVGEIGASIVYRPPAYKAWARHRMAETLAAANGNLLEAALKFDIYFNKLGDNYAAKVDRMSMAHGLEVRSPFLDYRFMEYASRIPTRWKLTGRKTKILMKQLVRGIIPDEIIDRRKQGFAGPLGIWIAENEAELVEAVDLLRKAEVLDDSWSSFYLDVVFKRDHGIYREYKKRLYFLWLWYRTWVSPQATAAAPRAHSESTQTVSAC